MINLIGPPAQTTILVGVNNPDSIQIVWNSASNVGCGVVTYHVELRLTVDERLIKEDTTNNLIYTFTGLSSDTHYTAYVYGSNQAGDGETASIRVTTASINNNNNNNRNNNNNDDDGKTSVYNMYIRMYF